MTRPKSSRIDDPARLAAVVATGLLDTDPEPAFDDLASLASALLHAPFAFLTLMDSRRSYWKSRIGLPLDGPVQNSVDESFCQYVVASGQPLIEGDTAANPLTADNPSIEAMGVRAWAGFPVMSPDGHPLGSFCVVDTRARQWSDADVDVLRILSAAAGRELALRAAARRASAANEQLALLARVSQALTETLDAEIAVGRLARLVIPVLGDWSLVALAEDGDMLRDVGWWHARAEAKPVLDDLANERWVGVRSPGGATFQAMSSREPRVVYSGALETGLAALRSPRAKNAFRALAPQCYGAWPLVFSDTVHGVLLIARDAGREPFTRAEIDLANNIAQRAGTVLDNARLYALQQAMTADLARANERLREAARHDHAVARALQDAMLTRLPEPDHLHIAARYRAAESHDQVGGDWYDALLPPDGATTLMIGDVAGHDIAAATVMGQLRNLLRGMAWEHDDDPPSALITRLDRAMRDLGISTMTTLIVARIEQDDAAKSAGLRRLRWSCAGHPTPVRIDADGVPTLLTSRVDPPLATLRNVTRRDEAVDLGAGETLLLYTDGLIETRNHELDERQAQLLAVLEGCRELGLEDLLDAVVTGMVGDQPDDDVALLAVRFHPEDRPRPAEAGPVRD
ncbi:GAF domain-containing SpoIIE family protein phosphatase [uncultured Jatrophihabitans sp.]|uniref:GAF domain-containing SpoIIE family protein phosphatase n=1 Tax=uncultured Jatrophihabitans sp. TaxID=1610747 RepID=UPI0035C95F5D